MESPERVPVEVLCWRGWSRRARGGCGTPWIVGAGALLKLNLMRSS